MTQPVDIDPSRPAYKGPHIKHPALNAFGRVDILDGFDPQKHIIAVKLDGKIIGQISPARDGYHEMTYYQPYNVATPIGPAFDPAAMKRAITRVMFGNDSAAFDRAVLEIQKK